MENRKQGFPKVWVKCLEIPRLQDFAPNTKGFWEPWAAPKPPAVSNEPPSENFCLQAWVRQKYNDPALGIWVDVCLLYPLIVVYKWQSRVGGSLDHPDLSSLDDT